MHSEVSRAVKTAETDMRLSNLISSRKYTAGKNEWQNHLSPILEKTDRLD